MAQSFPTVRRPAACSRRAGISLYPLVWMATRIEIRDAALARWMLQPVMLASEQVLLVARKAQNA